MSLIETIVTVAGVMFASFVAGYMCNEENVTYYRNIVYSYECQETRRHFE